MPGPTSKTCRAIGSMSCTIATPSSAISITISTDTYDERLASADVADSLTEVCEHAAPAPVFANGGRGTDHEQRADHDQERERIEAEGRTTRPASRAPGPASAGPNARATVNCIELTRTALISTGRGTSWGTNACHAAVVMPVPRPEITTQTEDDRGGGGSGGPEAHKRGGHRHHHDLGPDQHRPAVVAVGERAGPAGRRSSPGRTPQNALTPTSAVECVSWSTTYGTVTVCIQVPVFEIRPAAEERREFPGMERGERRPTPAGGARRRVRSETPARPNLPARARRLPAISEHLLRTRTGVREYDGCRTSGRCSRRRDPASTSTRTVERRRRSTPRSWVDVGRNWLRGADTLLDALVGHGVDGSRGGGACTTGCSTIPGCRAGTATVTRSPIPSFADDPRRTHGALLGASSAPSASTTTATVSDSVALRTPTASCATRRHARRDRHPRRAPPVPRPATVGTGGGARSTSRRHPATCS